MYSHVIAIIIIKYFILLQHKIYPIQYKYISIYIYINKYIQNITHNMYKIKRLKELMDSYLLNSSFYVIVDILKNW